MTKFEAAFFYISTVGLGVMWTAVGFHVGVVFGILATILLVVIAISASLIIENDLK